MVTIEDVARAAGVSKGTVSLVYSGKRPISPATRARVLDAAAELDWVPSSRARALATRRSQTIGLVLARDPEIIATDSFFARFVAGAESVLATRSMGLLLQVVSTPEQERDAYRSLARGRADAVILTDLLVDDPRPALLADLRLPAVVVGASPDPAPHPRVLSDDRAAVRDVVDHLVGLGHERIAHVSGPAGYVHGHDRRAAFVDAMAAHGLDPALVVEGDFSAQSGREATARLLDADDRPSAIVYANDVMAIAGLNHAQSRGVRVPDDLAITGFDDIELAAHLTPSLTTVQTDVVSWGRRAAEVLLRHLDGAVPEDAWIAPSRLVVRESTAGAPAART
ncbi:LacI family DNA-binding transcriptional regulator [Isoptericola hypogeus]|uniref:LacI family DNA-binding transcriptional regulator n=1 Tax=Isoptericola hypogeus TaxID=300179 RepID=A0ABP4VEL6_9MICO